VNTTYSVIEGFSKIYEDSNFDKDVIVEVLKTDDYHGISELRLYLEEILTEYKHIVRDSMLAMLDI